MNQMQMMSYNWSQKQRSIVNSSTSAGSTSSGTTSKKRYVKSWERIFPWVYYDPGKKAMLCRSCVKHKMNNTFTNSGYFNFRKTTLDRHTKSMDSCFWKSSSNTVYAHNYNNKINVYYKINKIIIILLSFSHRKLLF